MDHFAKKELISFYNRHFRMFGDKPDALRWTAEGQRRRFKTLLEISGDFSNKEILDFGCGKGDFYGFIKDRNIEVDYCGIDINENLINFARSKYPDVEFLCLDIEEDEFNRFFDIIFICGVFNLKMSGIEENTKKILKRLFKVCREALHLNALSDYTYDKDVELYYINPEDILNFALNNLSSSVILRHGIYKSDFFLSVYPVK